VEVRNRTFGAFVMPIAFFTMVFAVSNDSSIQPLVPALQSYWLHAHVITCFVGTRASPSPPAWRSCTC